MLFELGVRLIWPEPSKLNPHTVRGLKCRTVSDVASPLWLNRPEDVLDSKDLSTPQSAGDGFTLADESDSCTGATSGLALLGDSVFSVSRHMESVA